ncbi:PQQ-binding-like beta-propeller repeat protein [Actinomadura sp. HBU206391]|nr:PQQ-binding-like beta-propeller repeat protein [Actinomadura sp. HBU206391]
MRSSIPRLAVVAMLAAAIALAGLLTAPVQAAATPQSVAYQINARHNGHLPGGVAASSLGGTPMWSRDLGGAVSYPIVAGGRVFVTAAKPDVYGTRLHALDAATGTELWDPIDLGGTYWWSALAYGGGRLYALNGDGRLSAFRPGSGKQLWSVDLPGQWSFSSAPTYRDGVVYTGGAGSGGTLYAVNAADGSIRWTQSVANGDQSSPAVTASAVYVSYACAQTYSFDPGDGAQIWHYSEACGGGGGKTAVVADNAVWIRDTLEGDPLALRSSDGSVRARYQANRAPAFNGRQGYFLHDGVLYARNTRTLAATWSFTGDGGLTSAPIVIAGHVYIGSNSGQVWALNEKTGQVAWTAMAGAPISAPDEHNVSTPLTGLAADGSRLIVPATNSLVAFGAATR